jgi:ABC-type multidrug transport system ATPase subunit
MTELTSKLVLKGLCKTYGNGVRALNNVDLEVSTGMFGLLGPNGAGKSTLMRTIATLQEPDSGSIHFAEIDVLRDKTAIRRLLGYLPQDFGVYPHLNALTLLDHFAVLKGIGDRSERRAVVEALLHRVNLWPQRKRRLGGFSGGMRQRFGIAQALLGDPKLIIVDEPTAGLDPEERRRFLNLLAEIGEHVVVVLSTHIVDDVSDLCPAMAIISEGQVIQTGSPKQAIEKLRGTTWKATVERDELDDYRQHYRVISTRLVEGRNVLHVLSEERPAASFVPVDPDLEDVYFSALRRVG